MITHLVSDVVRCLNQFPRKNGISDSLSPASIILGKPNPDYTCMRLEFGSYVQVFEDNEPSNTPKARSLGAIALNPTGNAQGDYFFLSLATGAKISRHQWTELPITDTAIARVEAIALNEGQPLIQESGLVVEWRPDQPIDDSEYDQDYVHVDAPADDFDDADFDPVDDDELADIVADVPNFLAEPLPDPDLAQGAILGDPGNEQQPVDVIEVADANAEELGADNTDDPVIPEHDEQGAYDEDAVFDGAEAQGAHDEGAYDEAAVLDHAAAQGAHDHEPTRFEDDDDDDQEQEHAPGYNLRARKGKTNAFKEAMDNPHNSQSYYPPKQFLQKGGSLEEKKKFVFGHVMTQMTAKAGIKKHGKAAEEALMMEFAQLEDLTVYESINPRSLTKDQRMGALRAINLIKEKRDGRLKGRTVADGRAQRSLYDKSETASPTVSTDALTLSIIVDAHEGRDVATADVAGAYLKADMDDFVIMKFVGESVDILCRMNSAHNKFVTIEKGTKVLYVRLIKAIYGCVKSALLWYDLFSTTLKDLGFVLNPYDPCIANCTIDGKQCTIAWYVDDNKVSHVDPGVVTMIIEKIEERFGKMTVTRGKEHTFLGMKIRYTDVGTAVVTMKEYLKEAIQESGMDITRVAATPARKNLFDVDEKSKTLGKLDSEVFHSVVAKLLYVSIRARMDILLAIGFLCTRVSKSTQQDRTKLKRVLEYIKGTMDLEYTLGADDMRKLRSWVDAAYAVHPDMKSHTGGVMSLGIGGILCKSTKQKLNTKSSTEAEVVGASDYLPNTMWVKMFLEAQGYAIEENFFEQDNESAIKLEKNGRTSAGPKSRHINTRYFWIKDRSAAEGITIRHCPTLQMLADFFTKPLQGSLFRKFRDVILGYKHVDTLALDTASTAEERVGKCRTDDCVTSAPGTEMSMTMKNGSGTEVSKKVTWAEVVKRVTNDDHQRKISVSRSLSRNNPVS